MKKKYRKENDMTEKDKENRIHSFALSFLERQQIIPNLYADQIIRGYKEGYNQAEKDLEVKEVEEEPSDDLEQEIENELERTWCGEYLDTDKFRESAKHFFELGLKAQKGE